MTAALSDNAVISQFDPETGLILYFELTEGEESAKIFLCNIADTVKVTEISADNESCYSQNGRLIVRGSRDEYVLEQDSSEPYFAKKYSMNTPREDRATLIETLYSGKIAPTAAESVKVINEKYPHLKAKLDYMAEKMSSNMGIVSRPNG